MKKLLVVLLTALMLFGCSSSKEVIGGDLDNIKDRGYIIVAMEGTWAPWTYHDENDALVGYDVEVGKYVADYLGLDVQYVEGEWDGLVTWTLLTVQFVVSKQVVYGQTHTTNTQHTLLSVDSKNQVSAVKTT